MYLHFEAIVNQFSHLELSQNAHLMLAKSFEKAEKFENAVEVYDNFANRHPQSKRAPQALKNKAQIQHKFLKPNELDRLFPKIGLLLLTV